MANTRKQTRSRKAAKRRTRRTKNRASRASRKSHGGARKRKSRRRVGGFDVKKMQAAAQAGVKIAEQTGLAQVATEAAENVLPGSSEVAKIAYGIATTQPQK